MRLNLRSAFLCTHAAAEHMKERGSGRIINLSSGSREGTPWMAYYAGNSAYAAAKAAIHGFTRNVALELAEYGVTVNAIAPGARTMRTNCHETSREHGSRPQRSLQRSRSSATSRACATSSR
jgi:NAD(P)-dependent dehydrogenase (short-subunit alcohol dehydrogenase family)